MERIVMLLRHGKSLHGFEYTSDFERPLAPRGIKAATRMGRLLRELNLIPDVIISSPANRALSTSELVSEQLDGVGLETENSLYSVSIPSYYSVIHGLDDTASRVLLVGHNFTIEEFADDLTGRGDIEFKTCSLAVINAGDTDWGCVEPGGGELAGLYHPRQLQG